MKALKTFKQFLFVLSVSTISIGLHELLTGSSRREAINSDLDQRKPQDTLFGYSEKVLFDTILNIHEKNCRQLYNSYENGGACDELLKCNTAKDPTNLKHVDCKKRFPSCLIIGVYKAGTRELLDFLMMHPMIVIQREPKYEISFFTKNWTRGFEWYRSIMPHSMPNQITIEKSPNYFFSREAPARIHQMNPDIKLILMIRNPAERTISHITYAYGLWRKQNRMKHENVTDFLDSEILGKPTTSNFIQGSKYDEPFHRYLQYFSRSQIHIVESEQFKRDPYTVFQEIETFLGLPHAIKHEDLVFNDEKGFFCLRALKSTASACYGTERGRKSVIDELKMNMYNENLRRIFKPHNERFFELSAKRFSWE